MNSVSTVMNSASRCRAQKPARAPDSVIKFIADGYTSKRPRPEPPTGCVPRTSAAAVFAVEVRQDVAAQQLDDAQSLRRLHTRPSQPEDEVVGFDPADPLLDLRDGVLGRAEDEAVAGELVEIDAEAFLARQYLVLPPRGIGVVFLDEERPRGLDRLLAGRSDVQFERDRPRRRHLLACLGKRLLVALPLPL